MEHLFFRNPSGKTIFSFTKSGLPSIFVRKKTGFFFFKKKMFGNITLIHVHDSEEEKMT
jgi:hypothetical protein